MKKYVVAKAVAIRMVGQIISPSQSMSQNTTQGTTVTVDAIFRATGSLETMKH